jgi:hypothetical protein
MAGREVTRLGLQLEGLKRLTLARPGANSELRRCDALWQTLAASSWTSGKRSLAEHDVNSDALRLVITTVGRGDSDDAWWKSLVVQELENGRRHF